MQGFIHNLVCFGQGKLVILAGSLSITVELIKDVQVEKVFWEWRYLNNSRILTNTMVFFLILQVTWGILYFNK
jgi:hypothetical protein